MRINKNNIAILALVAILAFVGLAAFQTPQPKFGVVNVSDVADKSKLGMREKQSFDSLRQKYTSMLQFMSQNKVMTREEITKLNDLWRIDAPTAAQTQEIEALKTTIQRNSQELRSLLQKLNPTEAEIARVRELSPLANATEDILPQLENQLGMVMRQHAEDKQVQVMEKARAAVVKVGARDGYTLIWETSVAPYGANDVTNAVLAVMDRDNP